MNSDGTVPLLERPLSCSQDLRVSIFMKTRKKVLRSDPVFGSLPPKGDEKLNDPEGSVTRLKVCLSQKYEILPFVII
jgi:hypothetical protein